MTATCTVDVFSSLDGSGAASGNWTGYRGKQGPELLDHRLALYGEEQRMVFGASTYRAFARMLASSTEEPGVRDPWVTRMRRRTFPDRRGNVGLEQNLLRPPDLPRESAPPSRHLAEDHPQVLIIARSRHPAAP